jgi:hypothetical protein
MQADDSGVSSDDATESVEGWCEMMRDGDLLDSMFEEVAKEISDLIGKAVVEAGWTEPVTSSGVVGAAICGDGACFADSGEARNQRPDEHRDIEFPVAADDIPLTRDVFDTHCWKERSQSASYEDCGELRIIVTNYRSSSETESAMTGN